MGKDNIIYKYEPLWGNWIVKEFLGQGSISEVYKVLKYEYDREYVSAVKVIKIPTIEQSKCFGMLYDGINDEFTEVYYEAITDNIIKEIDLLYKLRGNSNIISYEDHMIKKVNSENIWHIFIRMEYAKFHCCDKFAKHYKYLHLFLLLHLHQIFYLFHFLWVLHIPFL